MSEVANAATPKASTNGSNGAAAASAATPAPAKSYNVTIAKMAGSHGKPDKAHHDGEMDRLKKEIEKVQGEVNNVKSLLSGAGPSANTPQGQRRQKLRAELDELRGQQAGNKGARGKVLDELKALQEQTNKKVKDLQASRSKSPYKTVADVDSAIARLQAQVESGSMKIVDEKRALAEMTNLRKSRRGIEGFEAQQKAIDEDRKRADELRKTLDNPEGRQLSERYDAIKKELDTIQSEFEKSAGSRQKLIDQRTKLSAQLDDLYGERRERNGAYRQAQDDWYAKSQAEREKRAEAQRAERKAHEDSKRKEQEALMREEAAMPAFAQEIEDCDVLIAYFGGNATQSAAASKATPSSVPGAKQLDVRKVEADTSYGQAIKKKGSESAEDSYFAGSSAGGKKGKKQGSKKGKPLALGEAPADEDETPAAAARSDLKVPVGHLSALLSLSIPPPTSSADVPRVVENLKLKRRYFVENQDRKTKERIEEVEKRLGKAAIVDGGEEGEKEASA
ncbi:hypothetical protein BDZ90DRAFT_234509 [Jaminaea rosea]|uniref:Nuclear segregation protein Bfr1 n=1 Tax=Jaminaea rosea TaxID=1569628 RepID=A0A316UP02_9BASI|nr:hypothetical protein BDZ90DRAFT_234509 [Jaminaea rosea]PWN24895.1 hypothetical protein BDZ90DRAFT_234509 [Jaminaea rosea]